MTMASSICIRRVAASVFSRASNPIRSASVTRIIVRSFRGNSSENENDRYADTNRCSDHTASHYDWCTNTNSRSDCTAFHHREPSFSGRTSDPVGDSLDSFYLIRNAMKQAVEKRKRNSNSTGSRRSQGKTSRRSRQGLRTGC